MRERQLVVDMNLKMLSMAKVMPFSELKADALKPDQILRPCRGRSIGFMTSKNLGERPICFKLVSRNPYLMMMLIKFWETELSLLTKSEDRFTVVHWSLSILMIQVVPR